MELPVEVRFETLWWNNECDFEPHYYVKGVGKIQKVSGFIFRGNTGGTLCLTLNSEGVQ